VDRETRSESGAVLVEVTWLAILLLVPLVYVVLAVFEVQRAAFAATAAARAAGRAYVMAPTPAEAEARARAAGVVALADQGVDGAGTTLTLGCRPAGACLAPGSVVHVAVRAQVALPLLPPIFGDQPPSIRVEAEHTVPYGSFREDRS
jgi:Flp pilus assembly protein TadG